MKDSYTKPTAQIILPELNNILMTSAGGLELDENSVSVNDLPRVSWGA